MGRVRVSVAADPSPAYLTPADPDLTVTNIVDGDTLDLSDGRRVRVLGIDSPEMGECGFEEARQFTRATLLNEEVEVAGDPTQDAVDQHGRALLYMTRWGIDYSHVVIGAGWAKHYIFEGNPVRKAETLRHAEDVAKALKLGIWGEPCTPSASASAAPTENRQSRAPDDNDDTLLGRRREPSPAATSAPWPAPTRASRPTPEPTPAPTRAPRPNCHPSYEPCLPDGDDLDCPKIGHQVKVVGPDEYRLDADNDGTGCDSY